MNKFYKWRGNETKKYRKIYYTDFAAYYHTLNLVWSCASYYEKLHFIKYGYL